MQLLFKDLMPQISLTPREFLSFIIYAQCTFLMTIRYCSLKFSQNYEEILQKV